MENTWIFAFLSTLIVSFLSLIGVFLLSIKTYNINKILVITMCFSAGTMLGNAFFHILPESYYHLDPPHLTAWLAIFGFVVFFVMEKIIHSHNNKKFGNNPHVKSYGYISLYADSLHNFTDGVLIGSSWLISPEVGLTTTFAVILHEIPQEIADFGVLIKAGFSRKKALFFNFLSATTAIFGTLVTLIATQTIEHSSEYILPFAAGGFIFLATNGFFPEILKETNKNNYWQHLLFLILGLALIYFFTLHSGHQH